jgi:hypothetical protein
LESATNGAFSSDSLPAELSLLGDMPTSQAIELAQSQGINTIDVPITIVFDFMYENQDVSMGSSLSFKAVEGFSSNAGKFSDNYGNVAIIDCSGLNRIYESYFTDLTARFREVNQAMSLFIGEIPRPAGTPSFCTTGMTMEGVLKDTTKYYMGEADDVSKKVTAQADLLQKTMTLNSNNTISAPMVA